MNLKGIERPPILEYFYNICNIWFATSFNLPAFFMGSGLVYGIIRCIFYLLPIGLPIFMLIVFLFLQFKNRQVSKYHDWAFKIRRLLIVHQFSRLFFAVYPKLAILRLNLINFAI